MFKNVLEGWRGVASRKKSPENEEATAEKVEKKTVPNWWAYDKEDELTVEQSKHFRDSLFPIDENPTKRGK